MKIIFAMVSCALVSCVLTAQAQEHKSIHQLQSEQYQGVKGDKGAEQPVMPLSKAASPKVSKVVYGYDAYWSADTYFHYDLLTHISCFSVDVNSDGSLSNSHNFPGLWSATISLAHKNGVKVTLCATCMSSSAISSVLNHKSYRSAAAKNLVTMVRNAGCDGVNIDFEGLPSACKDSMVHFVAELNDSFKAWNPQSHVSLATPAVDWSGAWDYDSLAVHCDGLFIMAYDYFYGGSGTTGPVSPLDGYTYDVLWTIHDYVTYSGNRRNKLIAGFPYYGYDWPCAGTAPGSTTSGSGNAVFFDSAEVRAYRDGRQWYTPSSTPWYSYGSYRQCWFDDEVSLGYKHDAVWDSSLAGTGMWALGYDGDRHELWDVLRTSFNIPNDTTVNSGMEAVFLDTAAVPSADSVRPAGWLEGQNCIAVMASDYVHAGSHALKHCVKSWGKSIPYLSFLFQDVTAAPGVDYTLAGWARKNDGAGNTMRMHLEWYDAKHQLLRDDTTAALTRDSTAYRQLTTGSVTSPAGTAFARIKLNIWVDSSNGFWDRWDDISFARVTGLAGNPASPGTGSGIRLEQNRPNPFTSSTVISYQLPASGRVELAVYNVAGQRLRTLVAALMPAGVHSVQWDGRNDAGQALAGGIYFCRLRSGDRVTLRKMTMLR